MGREARCTARIDAWSGEGRLLLETDGLLFRGARRLQLGRPAMRRVQAENGWLIVDHEAGRAAFELGGAAPKWAAAILNPKTRAAKMDVRAAARALVVGRVDADFRAELAAEGAVLAGGRAKRVDLVFFAVETPADLDRLAALRDRIHERGAVWVIHPRGDRAFGHAVLAAAARAAGLVDNKAARFSDTHTALRLVVPLTLRR